MRTKVSQYLLVKVENLQQTITFFNADSESGSLGKRLLFLTQIDFWKWEVDELLFSFQHTRCFLCYPPLTRQ